MTDKQTFRSLQQLHWMIKPSTSTDNSYNTFTNEHTHTHNPQLTINDLCDSHNVKRQHSVWHGDVLSIASSCNGKAIKTQHLVRATAFICKDPAELTLMNLRYRLIQDWEVSDRLAERHRNIQLVIWQITSIRISFDHNLLQITWRWKSNSSKECESTVSYILWQQESSQQQPLLHCRSLLSPTHWQTHSTMTYNHKLQDNSTLGL